MAYQHEGFWQPMDTLREKRELEKYASLPQPPWLKTTNP
jgi:glucose-1-phosphate cytidylyltransferase